MVPQSTQPESPAPYFAAYDRAKNDPMLWPSSACGASGKSFPASWLRRRRSSTQASQSPRWPWGWVDFPWPAWSLAYTAMPRWARYRANLSYRPLYSAMPWASSSTCLTWGPVQAQE